MLSLAVDDESSDFWIHGYQFGLHQSQTVCPGFYEAFIKTVSKGANTRSTSGVLIQQVSQFKCNFTSATRSTLL